MSAGKSLIKPHAAIVWAALDSRRSTCFGFGQFFSGDFIVKRTYQPHRTRRLRTHGFRARMKTKGGQNVLNARRRKGRRRIAVTVTKK